MAEHAWAVPPADVPLLSRPAAPGDGSGHLLALLRQRGSGTVSELAAGMGVARSTVLQRLDGLVERGLVVTEPGTNGARGRPAARARFEPGAAVVLAAHVGMTGTRLAATDLAGEIRHERYISMDVPAGPDRMLADLCAAFDELVAAAGPNTEVAGVGVGLPSSIELLTYARSLGRPGVTWDREFFARSFRARYGAPVFLDLDVNLLALAERRKGWPAIETFVCVKLGTLINASIVVNGKPVRGIGDRAGELGHFKVLGSTVPCTCGGAGCLDAVASGNALVRQLSAAGLEVRDVSDVVELATLGQPDAVRAVRQAGRHIGEVLGSVVNLLNPGVIIAWGYLTDVEATLFAGIREGLYQTALPGSSERLDLRRTTLGVLAGVRGAAAMVTDEVLAAGAVDRLVATGSWADAWPVVDRHG